VSKSFADFRQRAVLRHVAEHFQMEMPKLMHERRQVRILVQRDRARRAGDVVGE
jgi:hypothetical protein